MKRKYTSEPVEISKQEHAARLKERIYITFTALAVLLASSSPDHAQTASSVLITFTLTVLGTLLAVQVAEVVAHLAVHQRPFSRTEFSHAASVTWGALGAVFLPFLLLVLAALGLMDTEAAIWAGSLALIAALVVIGHLTTRTAQLPWWQRFMALAGVAFLGLVVIALKLLTHG